MATSASQRGTGDSDLSRLRVDDKTRRYRYVRLRWRLLFAVIDVVGWAMFFPAHVIRRCVRGNSVPHRPRSILVVQLDHFGDAVLSTGLLRWLKERFPAASLEVLAAPWNRELLLELTPVDQVHTLTETRFARRGGWRWARNLLSTAWHLRRRRFDLAIDVRGELPHAAAMWLAGARTRIGWSAGGGGFLLTHSAAFERRRHEVESRAALAAIIAERPVATSEMAPRVTRRATGESSVAISSGTVGLHLSAGTAAKTWPADKWRELAQRILARDSRRRVALVGTKADQPLARRIQAELLIHWDIDAVGKQRVLDLTGRLSIPELADVLRRMDVFVGADSGPAHLAAACGTPAVAVYSGTNLSDQWRPWGPRVAVVKNAMACSPCHREVCPLAEHPCMRELDASRVMDAIEAVLAQAGAFNGARHSDDVGKVRLPVTETEPTVASFETALNEAGNPRSTQ